MSKTLNKKKLNLKEKLNDDTLDLSLCELETVPVKEILELTKVRKINLSYNRLTYLPEDFIKLQNIRELDLSKNHIKSLPRNFGALSNLKSLDLLGNELTGLPSSFSELKSLQWLDLKNNPLTPELKKVAGDCLDEAQCRKCASNVIKFIKIQAADEERQRQIDLKKKKEEQLKKEAEEREKANQLKLQKKQEREKRRVINEQRKAEREMIDSNANGHINHQNTNMQNSSHHANKSKNRNILKDCFGFFFGSALSIFFTIVLIVGSLIFISSYCDANKNQLGEKYGFLSNQYINLTLKFFEKNVCPTVKKVEKSLPMEKIDTLLSSYEIFDLFSSLFDLF